MNDSNIDPDLRSQIYPPESTSPPPAQDLTTLFQTTPPKRRLGGKLGVVLALLAVVLITGSVFAWTLLGGSGDSTEGQAEGVADVGGDEIRPISLSTVAYLHWTQEDQHGDTDCLATSTQLQWQPVFGGEENGEANPADVGDQDQIGQVDIYDVYENQVFFIAYPPCDKERNAAVWYSADAGKTYMQLYNFEQLQGDDELPGAVTSARFSSDGKTIIVGYIPAFGDSNIVMEIDPETKAMEEIFRADRPGVFLQRYNKDSQQVFYYKGCYACDALAPSQLYVYDIAESTETMVFDDPGYQILQFTVSDDLGRLLVVKTPRVQSSGATSFIIEEFDIASKTSQQLLVSSDRVIAAGYRADDSTIYYVADDGVYTLGSSGDFVNTFNAPSRPIYAVLHVDRSQVVVTLGDHKDRALVIYTTDDKSETNILSVSEGTEILGVTSK